MSAPDDLRCQPDIIERLRFIMPSSLNDAIRTMEDAAQEIERMRTQVLMLTRPNQDGASNGDVGGVGKL